MKERTKQIIIGISTIILIVLMIFFINFNLILANLAKISFYGVLLFILIYTLAFIFRTFRLKLIFHSLNLRSSFSVLYGAFGIGWGINEIMPGKFGDLARMEFIHQKEKNISLSKSLCGLTIERFIDILIIFLITVFALFYMYFNNIKGTTQLNLQIYIGIGAIVLLGSFMMVLILFFKSDWFLKIIGKLSKKLQNRLEIFLKSFLVGMNDFRKNKKKALIVGIISIPVWILESFTLVLLFYLVGYEINLFIIIFTQIILFFTKMFPITPGGWVISENIGAIIILLFYPSIPYINLLSIFILDHMLRVAYCLIYGASSTFAFNFKFKKSNLKRLKEVEIIT